MSRTPAQYARAGVREKLILSAGNSQWSMSLEYGLSKEAQHLSRDKKLACLQQWFLMVTKGFPTSCRLDESLRRQLRNMEAVSTGSRYAHVCSARWCHYCITNASATTTIVYGGASRTDTSNSAYTSLKGHFKYLEST